MATRVSGDNATPGGRDLRGPIGYLITHPAVRFVCAAAAFTTSLYAVRRSVFPATKLKRAAWTALAAVTAVEGAGLVAVLPQLQPSHLDEGGAPA
ncbi:MAG TPA: hypothetical protein VMU65_16315 [Candidatus Saccharimonadales bacterium]|nr:hypothetical protein [Candidatus Saccharimonadales bacterium]